MGTELPLRAVARVTRVMSADLRVRIESELLVCANLYLHSASGSKPVHSARFCRSGLPLRLVPVRPASPRVSPSRLGKRDGQSAEGEGELCPSTREPRTARGRAPGRWRAPTEGASACQRPACRPPRGFPVPGLLLPCAGRHRARDSSAGFQGSAPVPPGTAGTAGTAVFTRHGLVAGQA